MKAEVNKASEDFDFCFVFVFATSLFNKSIPGNLKLTLIWLFIVKGIGTCNTICSINFSIGNILLSLFLTEYIWWMIFKILNNSLEKGNKLAKHIIFGI